MSDGMAVGLVIALSMLALLVLDAAERHLHRRRETRARRAAAASETPIYHELAREWGRPA